jgi:hypothetical protein
MVDLINVHEIVIGNKGIDHLLDGGVELVVYVYRWFSRF